MSKMLSATPAVKLDVTATLADMVADLDQGGSDPETWPSWCDEDVWELGGEDEPQPSAEDLAEALPLDGLVDREADRFRAWGNATGALLADTLEALAYKIRLTDAMTPAEATARMELLDLRARDEWEAIGFEAARTEFMNRPPAGAAYGHDAAA